MTRLPEGPAACVSLSFGSGQVPGDGLEFVRPQEVVCIGERVAIREPPLFGLAPDSWMCGTDHDVWWLVDGDRRCLPNGL